MAENSAIEWTDHTFNPWTGCQPVSPGCDGCYAAAWAKRAGRDFAVRQRTKTWGDPVKWNDQHQEFFAVHRRRQRVFCASLADVFDNQVDPQWRIDLFNLILGTPNLDWLLLTKRIGNAARLIEETLPESIKTLPAGHPLAWPWPHVWIGATVCDQAEADRDVPKLLATPAAVRFLSIEPMLGPVDLNYTRQRIAAQRSQLARAINGEPWLDWVICGGESGPKARPMHPDWARSLRDQCAAAGVPFLFKQWGEWGPWEDRVRLGPNWAIHAFADGCRVQRAGKKAAGLLLDGRTHDGFPTP